MADFAAVLRKTIGALKENSPEARAKVYEKARATIEAKLAAISPPPPPQLVERQMALLEDAVATVEAEHAKPTAAAAPDDDLERLFDELNAPRAQPAPPNTELAPGKADEGEAAQPEEPAPGSEPEPIADTDQPAEPVMAEPSAEGVAEEAPHDEISEPEMSDPEPASWDESRQDTEWLESGAGDASLQGPEPKEAEQDVPAAADGNAPVSRRASMRVPVLLVLLLIALGGVSYGAWQYGGEIARFAGLQNTGEQQAEAPDQDSNLDIGSAEEEPAGEPVVQEARVEEEPATAGDPAAPAGEEEPRKFTQRLLPDGEEVEAGPAEDEPSLGEGTSVAAATQSSGPTAQAEDAAGAAPDESPAQEPLQVGQKAIFYEERTTVSAGSAESGSIVWSVVEESPGDDLPPEPAIRGEATIPEKGLQLKITIRRNADRSLPASHIMELIFLTPDDFQGGGINSVLRVAMKRSEQDTGSPLLGIPAKIADGFFLVALSDRAPDVATNMQLLQRQSWIDIPMVYTSGRRALITMEKGVPGDRVFDEAIEAWARASSG